MKMQNRLRNMTRNCKDSLTIEESALHRYVLFAINCAMEDKDELFQILEKM